MNSKTSKSISSAVSTWVEGFNQLFEAAGVDDEVALFALTELRREVDDSIRILKEMMESVHG